MTPEPRESNCLECAHAGRVEKGKQLTCVEYPSIPVVMPWAAVESGKCRGFKAKDSDR